VERGEELEQLLARVAAAVGQEDRAEPGVAPFGEERQAVGESAADRLAQQEDVEDGVAGCPLGRVEGGEGHHLGPLEQELGFQGRAHLGPVVEDHHRHSVPPLLVGSGPG
jgi:hypothetical protein